jgi:hypothetical protein
VHWPLERQVLLRLLRQIDSAMAAGHVTLETKTLAEWASAFATS